MSRVPRIVSLVPSATETLLSIGADVVACTRFCNQPGIVTVGGTKNPDVAAIVALDPDFVFVDTEENRREDADALADAGLRVEVTSVRSVADAQAAVIRLATVAGVDAPDPLSAIAEPVPTPTTAFVPIWRRPWMSINASTYGASLLRTIGIELVTASADDAYPTVELDAIASSDPQLVLVPSEPYSFSDAHVAALAAALPNATTIRVDGEDLFWWGVRTPAAQRRLRDVVAT